MQHHYFITTAFNYRTAEHIAEAFAAIRKAEAGYPRTFLSVWCVPLKHGEVYQIIDHVPQVDGIRHILTEQATGDLYVACDSVPRRAAV